MNKVSNSNNDYEILDDYSEILERKWSNVVRGKYYHRCSKDRQTVVKITGADGVKYVEMRWLKAQIFITRKGKLTAQLTSDIPPGEHRITLLIQERENLVYEEVNASEEGEQDVVIKTFKSEAIVTPDNKLTAHLDSDITPGKYQAILIIEEPINPPTLEATDEIKEENIEHSA